MPAITVKCSGFTVVDGELDEVDAARLPAERGLDGGTLVQRQIQVARQQVPGAGRDQAHRDPGSGQSVRDDPDRAVTARANHKLNTRGHGLLGHRPARVGGRGFQPQRVNPPLALHRLLDQLAKLFTDLGRVVDHRAPTASGARRGSHDKQLLEVSSRSSKDGADPPVTGSKTVCALAMVALIG